MHKYPIVKGPRAPFFVMFAFMKKGFLSCLFLAVYSVSNGQSAFFQKIDTLKSIYRTGGNLDTISKNLESFQASFYVAPNATYLSPFQLYSSNGSSLNALKAKENQLIFSALPHLGFFYGFGAQGSQRLKVDFQEAFKNHVLVNVSFDKTKGNGFLRNDAFSFQDFNARVNKAGTRYSMDLQAGKESVNRAWSNGLFSASPLEGVDLNLQAVQKENARSMQSLSFLRWQHRYDFNKDSLIGFGLFAKHEFLESKRDYQEEADLSLIYQNTYWNSDSTMDVFRERGTNNDLGVFFETHHFNVQSSLNHRFRSWHDQVQYSDTTEFWLKNELSYRSGKLQLAHQDEINLFGAGKGFISTSNIRLPLAFMQAKITHHLQTILPELMQRNYFSNNVQYHLNTLNKQRNQYIRFSLLKSLASVQMEVGYEFFDFKNVYVYDDVLGTWRNDAVPSNGIGQRFVASASWTKKGFQIQPTYRWTHFSNDLNFQPQHHASVHIEWKGGVFKAKKLRMLFALDAHYLSSFQQRQFIPQMGVFNLLQSNNAVQNGFANLCFTTALEVETFRFFVCVDNLGSFWTDPSTAFVPNYVFPSMQIKIGLTWDFWN